jgi:hypothetical protein
MSAHVFDPDPDGDCRRCPLPQAHPTHLDPALPSLPYGNTSGWSGSETSMERAMDADADGTTSERQAVVLRHLGFCGPTGATWKELAEGTGWHHGQASGALSVLHKEGRIARLTERRSRCQVYVLPSYVNDRDTAPHGRRRAADTVALIDAACTAAEDDMDTGADYYNEPVVPVSALRAILNGETDE